MTKKDYEAIAKVVRDAMPSADDYADFLKRVKEAEEVGLTPAEVWRADRTGGCFCNSHHVPTCPLFVDFKSETACRRCKRPTEYQAKWCYSCEQAMFGGE